jgi:septal ring factor EnvC (AmiA/AmiB activator)
MSTVAAVDVAHEAALARAYRDGQVDAKIEQHEARLDAINGSVARTATALAELVEAVHSLRQDFNNAEEHRKEKDAVIDMINEDRITALSTAKALRENSDLTRVRWEGWRGKVAWTLGIVTAVCVVGNFILHLWGVT